MSESVSKVMPRNHGGKHRISLMSLLDLRLSVALTVITQFAIFGLHAVHSILLARMLGPEGRGEYGTYMFYSQTLLYGGMLGSGFAIARRANARSDLRNDLVQTAIRVGLITGLGSMAIACLGGKFGLPPDKSHLIPYAYLVSLLLPLEHIRLSLLSVDHGASNYRRYNQNRMVAAISFPLLLIATWAIGLASLTSVAIVVVLSAFVSLIALLWSHRSRVIGLNAPSTLLVLRESLPYGSTYLAGQLLGRTDVFLSIWLMTFEDQGRYAVAIAVVGLMQLAPNALSLFSFNFGADNQQEINRSRLVFQAIRVLALQSISALVFAIAIPFVVPFAFGNEYYDASWMSLILLPGLAVDGLANVAESYARGKGRPLLLLWPKLIASAVLISVALALQSKFSVLAVPIAASTAYVVNGLITCILVLRMTNSTAKEASLA